MYCIFCGHYNQGVNLSVCQKCGKELYKDVSASQTPQHTEMRIISGSEEMIKRIPTSSPISNKASVRPINKGLIKRLALVTLCVGVVTTGFFTVKRLLPQKSPTTKSTASAGLFSGGGKSDIPFSTNLDSNLDRIFADDKYVYCFRRSSAFGVKVNAKTGEVTKINEENHVMEFASAAGKYIFFLSNKELSKDGGTPTVLYAYDTKSGDIKPVEGIEDEIKLLNSDGKNAYLATKYKGGERKFYQVDGKTLKVTQLDVGAEVDEYYRGYLCVYNDKLMFKYFDNKAEEGKQSGIATYDLQTKAFDFTFPKRLDFSISDKGILMPIEGKGLGLLNHDGSDPVIFTEEVPPDFFVNGDYVYYWDEDITYRAKTDGTDLKIIPIKEEISMIDVSGEWVMGGDRNGANLYKVEDNKITMAVYNVYGTMKKDPVIEKLNIPLEDVNR